MTVGQALKAAHKAVSTHPSAPSGPTALTAARVCSRHHRRRRHRHSMACRFALVAAFVHRRISYILSTRMSITSRPSLSTHAVLVQALPVEDECTSTKRRLVLGPC
jgi:hypothetical protein